MPDFPSPNPIPLATLKRDGTAPKQRLVSAVDASALFWLLHEANLPRERTAAIIQGDFDGNPPYNNARRRNQGQAWMANVNPLGGQARLEAAKAPFYDLFSAAPTLALANTDVSSDEVDAATAGRERTLAFDRMLKTYLALNSQFNTMLTDFIAFNKGFLWWPRPDSWHFKRLPWNRVLFPEGTSNDPDEWEVFALRHEWNVTKLYSFVRDEEAATAAGWNVKQVWAAIRSAIPSDMGISYQDPMAVQRAVRDQELYLSARCGTVRAASLYVKEFDGRWSRMMVQVDDRHRDRDSGGVGGPTGGQVDSYAERFSRRRRKELDRAVPDAVNPPTADERREEARTSWLFNKVHVADSLYDIICPFIFEANDGSVNELAGLGKKTISYSQADARLFNTLIDNSLIRGCINLQAQNGMGMQKAGTVQLGGGIVTLPAGYAVQPGTIFGDLEGGLAVSQEIGRRLDQNTGIYRPAFDKPRGNPETATAAQMRFSQSTVLTTSAVQRFYSQLDVFYYQVYKRASRSNLPRTSKDEGIKAAVAMQDALEDKGLSKKQIEDCHPASILAARSFGNGSPVMRQQSLSALGYIVPFMGPRGLTNYKVDYAAAYAGQEGANRYFPREDLHQEPTQADREAVSENNDMQTGASPLFLESDDHAAHAKIHLMAVMGAIQSVQQGADPATPYTFISIAMPHIVQHISKVPREQERKALEQAYTQAAQGVKLVEQAAQQSMQQQQQGAQMTFEQQLAVNELQHKQMIAEQRSQGMLQLKQQRQQIEIGMSQQKAAQEAALKDADVAGGIQRTSAQTVSDIKLKQVQTASDIELARRKAEADIEVAKQKAAQKPAGGSGGSK